jgi:DNA polymerase-3 subunit delta'
MATALKTAELLQRTPLSVIIAWQQRWLYDLLSFRMSSRLRYFPRHKEKVEAVAARVRLTELLRLIKLTSERNRVADHPLDLRLQIEDILLDYLRLFS